MVSKANPEFDPRNYGKKKLGDLVKAQDYLVVRNKPAADGSPTPMIHVRLKDP